MQSPASSSPSPSPWKSLFRLPSSSKKHTANRIASLSSQEPSSPAVSSPSPSALDSRPVTPRRTSPSPSSGVLHPGDQRFSNNSSFTLSSDSNLVATPKSKSSLAVPESRGAHALQAQQPTPAPSPPVMATTTPSSGHTSSSRSRTKSGGIRLNLNRPPLPPPSSFPASQQSPLYHSAGPPASYLPPTPTRTGPFSPRAMGASATRFIRRVASAPNAKQLFSGSRPAAPMKDGLLAPADVVPPVLLNGPSSSSEHGADSLETLSSGSSRGRVTRRQDRYPHSAGRPTGQNVADGRSKVAFRRTYSSNSIRVRSVCVPRDLAAGCRYLAFFRLRSPRRAFSRLKCLARATWVACISCEKRRATDCTR